MKLPHNLRWQLNGCCQLTNSRRISQCLSLQGLLFFFHLFFIYLFFHFIFCREKQNKNRPPILFEKILQPRRVVGLYTSGKINVSLRIRATQPCEFVVVWAESTHGRIFSHLFSFHAGSLAKHAHPSRVTGSQYSTPLGGNMCLQRCKSRCRMAVFALV